MKPKKQSPIWPYLVILACLFLLSVTAPRAWDRMARQQVRSQASSQAGKSRPITATTVSTVRGSNSDSEKPYEQIDRSEFEARDSIRNGPFAARGAVEPASIVPAEAAAKVSAPTAILTEPVGQIVPPAPEFSQPVGEDTLTSDPTAGQASEEPQAEGAPRQPSAQAAVAGSAWPLPQMLLEQLQLLREDDPSAVWAERAIERIKELCQGDLERPRPVDQIIADLRAVLTSQTASLSDNRAREAENSRARYALARWVDVWESVAALEQVSMAAQAQQPTPDQLQACLAQVDTMTRKGAAGAAWRKYVRLERLLSLAGAHDEESLRERRAIARQVLDRLDSSRLTQAQQKFIADSSLAKLQTDLRSWAAEAIAPAQLLKHVEQYERTGSASDAGLVANDWRGLNWSSGAESEQASGHLETHYRNANVRVAVAGPLMNRLVPQPKEINAPVRDTVMNVPTYGNSTTFTNLSVRLVPDPRRIRLGLEANGLVASNTISTSGPAKFHNTGQSTFLVRKLLVLGPYGLSVWPAVAQAENDFTYLVSLETDFDGVPLVGSLVRNIALSQHEEARDEARMEVQQKVASRARRQLDAEVRPHLVKAAENVQKQQLATLNRLGLEMVPVGLSTTEERVVARLRLAAPDQLGAHTPRPRAPSDSWFSLQVHQSALNNIVEQLDLDGRELSLAELFAWIAAKMDRPALANLEDLPENVHVKFASQDAVRLRCDANLVELTISMARLTQGSTVWRNFTVRAFYRPEADGLDAKFVRDSAPIQLEGASLKGKPVVGLRLIFSKVLSRNRAIHLLSEKVVADPRGKDLYISQFVVDDGWIGLAYSPRRQSNNVARRPQ